MHEFVIISNRLPISVSRKDGKLEFNVSSGGLATAMSSLDVADKVWVGWPGIACDDLTDDERKQIDDKLAEHGCRAVHLTREQVANFYEGYANDTLWPLFHYFQGYAKFREDYWRAYREVNWQFVDAARQVATENAMIWVQDYQLMLAPAMLRSSLPSAKIGFFLHIPFPSYELFRQLPESTEILEGLLGSDLIGFHIYEYAKHFVNSCTHILGTTDENGSIEHDGRRVGIDAFPIGIDYEKFRSTLKAPGCRREITQLKTRYRDQKLILSMDRLDYSKGIMKRLEAYELLLDEHPELHRKVTMLMIAVPSRTEVDTYQQLRDQIEQSVSRINGMFGSVDWAPISYQFQNLPFASIVGLLNRSDVALVTPLRDGMNLVAKEFVASQSYDPGVLILSEMTGAAEELTGALLVNPNNVPSLARKIHRALTMPKQERADRIALMQKRISTYTVQEWGQDFMQQLGLVSMRYRIPQEKRLTAQTIDEIVTEFQQAKSRLLLLDYDGTLRGFSADISTHASQPEPGLLEQLARITAQPNTKLAIISGRPRTTLETWFGGIDGLMLVAEHGAWVKTGGSWEQRAEKFDTSGIVAMLHDHATRTPGAIVEEKDFAIVWHYRGVSPELAYVRNLTVERELAKLTPGTDLVVHRGNKIIEIKPKTIDKGSVARALLEKYPSDFVLCAGDDYTDEHMFQALPAHTHTVKVGAGNTHARWQTGRLERMLALIEKLSS